MLEHVVEPIEVIHQTRKWLKPDGTAIFTVPNRDSLHRRIGKTMGILAHEGSMSRQDDILDHRRVYGKETLEDDLKAGGYKSISVSGYNLKLVPLVMMPELEPTTTECGL